MSMIAKEAAAAQEKPSLYAEPVGSEPLRIVFLERQDLRTSAIASALTEEGFEVQSFFDSETMITSLEDGLLADIVLLDCHLQDVSGLEVLTQLRSAGIGAPLVILTEGNSPAHEQLAFVHGASEFIDKARGMPVLVARLRRLLQSRTAPCEFPSDRIFRYGSLVLHAGARRCYWDDVDVRLTVSEFKIVELLVSKVGRYVSYRQIYDTMHYVGFAAGSGADGYRTNVRSAIKRVRTKFRTLCPDFEEISNYNGFGYRWGK